MVDREIVNALSIGVKADGKHNCSRKINRFLKDKRNFGKTLVLPYGKYLIRDSIRIDKASNIKLEIANDCVFYKKFSLRDFIRHKLYGEPMALFIVKDNFNLTK